MQNGLQDSAYIVVVVHGARDISRTAWPDAAEAERYMERLRERGVPADNIRLYRARVVVPASPDHGIAL